MEEVTSAPELSVIVAAVDDYATTAEALRAVEDQTVRAALEVVVVTESLGRLAGIAELMASNPRLRVVEVGRPLLLHEARAIGVAHARAEYVFLLEDHCLPRPDCLARLLVRLREDRWAVVGPGFASGNRHSVWGRAANLLTYGEWMGYRTAEERPFVSGYSSAWRRASLERLGGVLERELSIPSRLQQRLRQAGERLFFEPAAEMLHWESSYHGQVRHILLRQGRGMGFVRQGGTGALAKLRASLLVPALVLYRALRGVRAWRRTGSSSLRVVLALPWLSLVWCWGELCGYWTGDGEAALGGVSEVERNRQPHIDDQREPIRRPWA